MRTAISRLSLVEPRSLRHALRLMHDQAPLVPLAGCTDLYVALNDGALRATRFLNLWPIEELRVIEPRGPVLFIGALATYSSLIRSADVRRSLPMLVAAAREVGGRQVQNRGTLGGNIANGSPAGDTLPVLAAAEATVVLGSADSARRVPFTAFYTAYRTTVMRPDELILGIEVPKVEGRQWFCKIGTRSAQAISKVVMAAVRAPHPRIAFGSVAPTVVRAPQTESALARGAGLDVARSTLMTEIAPIDDIRSTAAYRRHVAGVLLERFWRETAG
jgi:CO/xanthine dehydrogenase FAD-binding subunit